MASSIFEGVSVLNVVSRLLETGTADAPLVEFLRSAAPAEVELATSELKCLPTLVQQIKDEDAENPQKLKALQLLGAFALVKAPSILGCVCTELDAVIACMGLTKPLDLAAVHCLEALSTHTLTEHIMSKPILPHDLKRLLSIGSEECIYHVVILIGNLASDSDTCRIQLCEQQFPRLLTHLIMGDSQGPETKEQVVRALACLAQLRPGSENLNLFPEYIAHLAAVHQHPGVQTEGVMCLQLLAERAELNLKLRRLPAVARALSSAACSQAGGLRTIAEQTAGLLQIKLDMSGGAEGGGGGGGDVGGGGDGGGGGDDWLAGTAAKAGGGKSRGGKKKGNKKKK
jgi:uncharacterized membrane protein YgcG